jgi:hypothetical protein
MNALELRAAGVTFLRDDLARWEKVRGPSSAVSQVHVEVARRVDAMRTPAVVTTQRWGACEACGDAMLPHCSGWCELCCLARRVALKAAR